MAWMLWLLMSLDYKAAALSSLKAGGGALAVYVGKKLWSRIMPETNQCNIKKCFGTAYKRGLCMKCYGKARKKVDEGVITWERLAELGLCNNESEDPFNDAYSRALKEDN